MLFGYGEKIHAFKKLIANGNLGQSYLFLGDKQIGKATFARMLASFLEYGDFEETKRPLIDSRFFGADENGVIGIATAIEIKQFLWATPFHSSRRLAVIDEIETITAEAQGALLKIVEEPPQKAMLIFIGYDADFLFPPLLSRLNKVYFPRLSRDQMEKALAGIKVPAAQARAVSKKAFGRFGYALQLLNGGKSEVESDLADEIESRILALRENDLLRNYSKISALLDRLTLLKRYNLNANLQRKAVNYAISHD